jgi:hypothetical protein
LLHRENVWAFENAGQLRFIFGSERLRHQSPDGQGRRPTNIVMERGENWRTIQKKQRTRISLKLLVNFQFQLAPDPPTARTRRRLHAGRHHVFRKPLTDHATNCCRSHDAPGPHHIVLKQ